MPAANRPCSTLVMCVAFAGLAVLTACSGSDGDGDALTLPPSLPVTAPTRPFELAVPLCDELPDPADSLDWSGVQRTDVADPARTGEALVVALGFPYVVDYWGGTGLREGWIVVGVSGGAVELQAMLDTLYPGARVLAMPLDWTPAELSELATRVEVTTTALGLAAPPVVSVSRGVVRVQMGDVTEARMATLEPFAGERVCVDGTIA